MEAFKPSSVSISQLFGDPKILYRIPQYQRPYKWENEQIEQLWDDIFEAYENNTDNYFLGSIITAKSQDYSDYIDVVDGQQRLTTLMILFCVLRDNFIDIDAIKSLIKQLNNRVERLKLFTHEKHQSDFYEIILREKSTCEIERFYKYQLKEEQEPKYKFRNTASIFKEKLKNLTDEQRGKFVNYLFNNVQLIRIDCSNRDFAIKLFQVLNNRGMDLTASDLIKSFLIGNLNNFYKNEKDLLNNNERRFMSDWHIMEENIKNSDINLSDLLIIYEYYSLASNPKKSLTEELQNLFKNKDPNEIINKLKEFSEIYKSEISDTKSKIIYSFRYIPWSMYWKTIVMTASVEKYEFIDELLKELRKFYYLYWIAGKTLTQIKQSSFNVIKAIKENKHINYIKTIFKNKINEDKIVFLVKENIKLREIDEEAWIKPLLIMMEYEMTDNSSINYIKLDKNLHLDHILPKKYKENEWNYITETIAHKWIRSVANLTLLSDKKNIEASNFSFDKKMGIYASGKGSNTTSFRISQHILDDYNNNKYDSKWNEAALKNRWQWFFSQLEKILEINCSDLKSDGEPSL